MSKRDSDVGRLGGGLISAAIGLSEWKSPLDAYLRITGEVEDVVDSEAADRGIFLEPSLRAWYAKKTGAGFIQTPPTLYHPDVKWASYSPDGIAMIGDETRLTEFKAPGYEVGLRYGQEGTAEVPRDVLIQGAWGLYVLDHDRCDFAALIDGKLKIFTLMRDVELEQEIFDRARFFMQEYVEKKRPPPPTFSAADTTWVKKKFPKGEAEKRLTWSLMSTEEKALVMRYIETYREQGELTDKLQALENVVKLEIIKDASGIDGDTDTPFTRIDWKNNEKAGPKWKQVAEELITKLKAAGMADLYFQDLIKRHTDDPPRVFRPWFKRGTK